MSGWQRIVLFKNGSSSLFAMYRALMSGCILTRGWGVVGPELVSLVCEPYAMLAGATVAATCSLCQAGSYWTGSGESGSMRLSGAMRSKQTPS